MAMQVSMLLQNLISVKQHFNDPKLAQSFFGEGNENVLK